MSFWATLFSVIALDQLSKAIVLAFLPWNSSCPLLGQFLQLTLIYNKGAAFGLFPQAGTFFLVFSMIVATVPFLFLSQVLKRPALVQVGVALICGGALGNVLDRLSYRYVVDFIHFSFWPVFNIADSAIFIGSLLFILSILPGARKSKKDASSLV